MAISGEEISIDELREFPILEEVRHDPRFAQYRVPKGKTSAGKKVTNRKPTRARKKAPTRASRTTD